MKKVWVKALFSLVLASGVPSARAVTGENKLNPSPCELLLIHENSVDYFRKLYAALKPVVQSAAHNPFHLGGLEGAGVAVMAHSADEISYYEGFLDQIKEIEVDSYSRTYGPEKKKAHLFVIRLASGGLVELQPSSILEMRFHVRFVTKADFEKKYATWFEIPTEVLNRLPSAWINRDVAFRVAFPGQVETDTGVEVAGTIVAMDPYSVEIIDGGGYVTQRVSGIVYTLRAPDGTLKRVPSHLVQQFRSYGQAVRVYR